VGTGKTGTSAIQTCLAENRSKLQERGVLYPTHEMLAVPGADVVSSGNGGPLLFYLTEPMNDAEFLENFASVLSGPEQTIVISNEVLEYGDTQKFADLRDFCAARDAEIKIVYLVRDIAAHAFSSWRQIVTHAGYTGDWGKFQKYYTSEMNIFGITLAKFTSILSRENLVVANYSSLGRHVTESFFSIIGEDYATYEPAQEVNRSSSLKTTALMLEFNRCLKDMIGNGNESERSMLTGPFYAAVLRRLGPDATNDCRVSLTLDEYQMLKERCRETVDQINTVYLPDDPIQIAEPEEIGAPLKISQLTFHGQQAVRQAAEQIVADSKQAPDQRISLDTCVDEILGAPRLFAKSWSKRPGQLSSRKAKPLTDFAVISFDRIIDHNDQVGTVFRTPEGLRCFVFDDGFYLDVNVADLLGAPIDADAKQIVLLLEVIWDDMDSLNGKWCAAARYGETSSEITRWFRAYSRTYGRAMTAVFGFPIEAVQTDDNNTPIRIMIFNGAQTPMTAWIKSMRFGLVPRSSHVSSQLSDLIEADTPPPCNPVHAFFRSVGWTNLHFAANFGNFEIVSRLLEQGVPADIAELNGATPLHRAVDFNHIDIVEYLLNKGANPNAFDRSLWETPLGIALRKNHQEAARLLLSKMGENTECST
jgi:hypothetical protein